MDDKQFKVIKKLLEEIVDNLENISSKSDDLYDIKNNTADTIDLIKEIGKST